MFLLLACSSHRCFWGKSPTRLLWLCRYSWPPKWACLACVFGQAEALCKMTGNIRKSFHCEPWQTPESAIAAQFHSGSFVIFSADALFHSLLLVWIPVLLLENRFANLNICSDSKVECNWSQSGSVVTQVQIFSQSYLYILASDTLVLWYASDRHLLRKAIWWNLDSIRNSLTGWRQLFPYHLCCAPVVSNTCNHSNWVRGAHTQKKRVL